MISVVTPTYYRNERLERAIRSVQDQTYPDVEHVVVDGSAEEHARDVVEAHEDTVYVGVDADPGLHACRELGCRAASGEFVQFLDDDDWLEPTKLEASLSEFEEGVGIVYTGIRHGSSGQIVLPDPDAAGRVLDRALAFDMFPAVPSTWLVRRELVRDAIPFDHPDGADDEGTHIELAQQTDYAFVDEPLVVLGTESEQSVSQTWTYVEGLEYLLTEYAHLYDRAPDQVERRARETLARNRGTMLLRERVWSPTAIREFVRAARYSRDDKPVRWGNAFVSLFGRPGVYLGEKALTAVRSRRAR